MNPSNAGWQDQVDRNREQSASPVQTEPENFPGADDPNGNYVLRRRQGCEGVGPVLYRFSASSGGEAIQTARRWAGARGIERTTVYLDSTNSLSPEELRR